VGNLKERDHFENLDTDGRIILKFFGMREWITLAHNGDKWQAFVNTVMNIWVP